MDVWGRGEGGTYGCLGRSEGGTFFKVHYPDTRISFQSPKNEVFQLKANTCRCDADVSGP